ncbi:MAG: endo-1,4-beta-xylanase, partial [Bacteroidota bacterium]
KLSNIAVGEGTYEWTHADEAVRFAEANDIRLHGHTLFWHYSIPGFIREMEGDTARIGQIFDQIVDDYIGRYKGKVAGWDIVNEVVNDQSDSMRETFWYRNLGPGYIARAFRRAHAADPDAILFYNEYKIARDSLKFSRVLKVLDELQADDVPIHGVGFQMHVEYDVPSLDQVRNVFRELVKRDLVIHVSELDIAVNPRDTLRFTVMTDSLLQRQRERIEQLTQIYIEEVPEDLRYGITMWGVSDKYSWYRTYLRYLDWPLLFDSHYRPKPAYDGLLEAARAGAPRKSGAS